MNRAATYVLVGLVGTGNVPKPLGKHLSIIIMHRIPHGVMQDFVNETVR